MKLIGYVFFGCISAIIALITSALIFAIFDIREESESKFRKKVKIVSFVVIFSLFLFAFSNAEYTIDEKTYPLVCLETNTVTNGSFFLGFGSFDDEFKYMYAISTVESDFVPFILSIDDVDAVLEDSETPYVLEIYECFSTRVFDDDTLIRREIHVPEGTIKYAFNLDMK